MKRTPIMKIELSDDEKKRIFEEMEAFYLDVRGEKIGIIKQQQLLEFFMEQLAPTIYNKALDDAKRWYTKQQENMDTDFYMLYKDL